MRFDNCVLPFEWQCPLVFRFDRQQYLQDPELQNLIKRNDRIIVDFSTDPLDRSVEDEFRNLAKELEIDKKLIYLTGDWSQRERDEQTVFWPRMFDLMNHHHKHSVRPTIEPRSYRLGSLNGMPRPHRFLTLYLIEQQNYHHDGIVSCRGLQHLYTQESMSWNHGWFDELPNEVIEQLRIDGFYRPVTGSSWEDDQHGFTHPAFTDCYLNLVTESDLGDCVYISEKLFKPLAAGQLFLTAGHRYNHCALRWLGFDCFDDIFHNHEYENLPSWQDRIYKMIKVLDDVWNNIPDIYNENHDRLLENQNYVLSQTFINKIRQPLVERDML